MEARGVSWKGSYGRYALGWHRRRFGRNRLGVLSRWRHRNHAGFRRLDQVGKGDQLSGEEAFYQMITLREGDFRLETGGERPARTTITVSPEALLLEGMRLLDERRSAAAS